MSKEYPEVPKFYENMNPIIEDGKEPYTPKLTNLTDKQKSRLDKMHLQEQGSKTPSGIQVEMPKWKWLAMSITGTWKLFIHEPTCYNGYGGWSIPYDEHSEGECSIVKVIGFTGTWQDSLHQYVDGKWEHVK